MAAPINRISLTVDCIFYNFCKSWDDVIVENGGWVGGSKGNREMALSTLNHQSKESWVCTHISPETPLTWVTSPNFHLNLVGKYLTPPTLSRPTWGRAYNKKVKNIPKKDISISMSKMMRLNSNLYHSWRHRLLWRIRPNVAARARVILSVDVTLSIRSLRNLVFQEKIIKNKILQGEGGDVFVGGVCARINV